MMKVTLMIRVYGILFLILNVLLVSLMIKEIYELNERLDKIEDKYLDGDIDKNDYTRMTNRVKQQIKTIEDRKELLETPNRGKVEPKLKYS